MANTDNPFGFRAIRHRNGAPYCGNASLYHVAGTDAQTLAPGDPVKLTGTADTHGIPTVTRAAAGDRLVGVFMGRTPGEGDLIFDDPLNTRPSTVNYILVIDDPDVVFEVQADGAIAAADIGLNADFVAADPIEGRSHFELDASTAAATVSLPLKIIRLVRREDNELGAFAKVEVMINKHAYGHATTGT